MRLAVEFKRFGAAKYVSHLDMQRTVMRAIRRSGLEPEYSQGFNPHMLLSFASAMPVGLESDSEYFELKLEKDAPEDFCLSELKRTMPEGIMPVWVGKLSENAPKLMASLKYASYEALINHADFKLIEKLVDNLLQLDKIEVEIEKKGTASKKDIRPLVFSIKTVAEAQKINMIVSFSSEGSLNPEILMHLLAEAAGGKLEFVLKRTGLFTIKDGTMIPLKNLCD